MKPLWFLSAKKNQHQKSGACQHVISKSVPRAYRAHDFIKEQPVQLLLMKVDHQAFGVLLQPVILVQTFHR